MQENDDSLGLTEHLAYLGDEIRVVVHLEVTVSNYLGHVLLGDLMEFVRKFDALLEGIATIWVIVLKLTDTIQFIAKINIRSGFFE